MQRLEVSGAVRLIHRSLGVKGLIYLLTLGYMFRLTRNHRQALSKNTNIPLHKAIKTRFGITNVHNKLLVNKYRVIEKDGRDLKPL